MKYKYKICLNFKWPSSNTQYKQHHNYKSLAYENNKSHPSLFWCIPVKVIT